MILMYHHVAPPEAIPANLELDGWVFNHTPKGFERQLRELLRRGYRFESLADSVRRIHRTGSEAPGTVQLTFDDGWLDNYQFAFPILRKLQLTATFFITTDHLYRGVDDPKKMNVDQLREMVDAGMTIGGHTRSHPTLTELSESEVLEEVGGCKEDAERALGIEVELFAYPGGRFNPAVARIVREAGFKAACSVLGPARNDASTLFWQFRDLLSEEMNTRGDRYRLSSLARRLFEFRVKKRLAMRLEGN